MDTHYAAWGDGHIEAVCDLEGVPDIENVLMVEQMDDVSCQSCRNILVFRACVQYHNQKVKRKL